MIRKPRTLTPTVQRSPRSHIIRPQPTPKPPGTPVPHNPTIVGFPAPKFGPIPKKISLITCTTNRPYCFTLHERWMKRMLERYDGEAQLIVVDGGEDGYTVTPTLGQEYYKKKFEPTPLNSFWGNMAEGFSHIKHDVVGFIEDDDYYKADFLVKTLTLFGTQHKANIVGEGNAKYWHVPSRGWVNNNNHHHASLCQTMLCGPMVDLMRKVIDARESPYLDMIIWRKPEAKRVVIRNQIPWCVGMKGMPGRGGFVPGHKDEWYRDRDPTGNVLVNWIGKEDADIYLNLGQEV